MYGRTSVSWGICTWGSTPIGCSSLSERHWAEAAHTSHDKLWCSCAGLRSQSEVEAVFCFLRKKIIVLPHLLLVCSPHLSTAYSSSNHEGSQSVKYVSFQYPRPWSLFHHKHGLSFVSPQLVKSWFWAYLSLRRTSELRYFRSWAWDWLVWQWRRWCSKGSLRSHPLHWWSQSNSAGFFCWSSSYHSSRLRIRKAYHWLLKGSWVGCLATHFSGIQSIRVYQSHWWRVRTPRVCAYQSWRSWWPCRARRFQRTRYSASPGQRRTLQATSWTWKQKVFW